MSIRIQVEVKRADAPYFSGSFERAPISVGSAADNDVVLAAPDVTDCHGTIRLSDAGLVFDDKSLEGSFLGEERIEGSATLGVRGILSIPPFELDLRLRSTTPEHGFERYKTNAEMGGSFDSPDTRPILEATCRQETPSEIAVDEKTTTAMVTGRRSSLVIIDGPEALRGQEIEIQDGTELVLGRSERADIRLADRAVSRRHATLRRSEKGRLHLVDLKSVNGVFLNGDQIESEILEDGDEIRIGSLTMSFRLQASIANGGRPSVAFVDTSSGSPTVIQLHGRISGADSDRLATMLETVLTDTESRWLIVDGEHATEVGDGAFAALAVAHSRLAERGGGLLLAGVAAPIAQKLGSSHLAGSLDVCRVRDRYEALRRAGS